MDPELFTPVEQTLISESEMKEIHARQEQLAREALAEETARIQAWERSRVEGPGVTPGVRAVTPLVYHAPKLSLVLSDEAPEDICDFVPHPDEVDPIRDSTAHLDDPEVNPKQAMATRDQKVPLQFLEPVANAEISRALAHGGYKYGRRNFYKTPILASVYIGAVRRHIDAFHDGEDVDPDSGLSHWAHIGANVHVMLAAMREGTFVDDRGPEEQSDVQRRLSEASNRGC